MTRIFSRMYDLALRWARHRHAPWYLAALAFAESSFFPVPPDVMLAPMSLAHPARAWRFAALATLASTVGGLFGYLIGYLAFDLVHPLILEWGYGPAFDRARAWFAEWGFWAIFLAGFSPIPYKVFTITAGVISMALLPFAIASAVGRGARFFLVAGVIAWGGKRMEARLREYVDRVGWLLVILVVVIYLVLQR